MSACRTCMTGGTVGLTYGFNEGDPRIGCFGTDVRVDPGATKNSLADGAAKKIEILRVDWRRSGGVVS